MSIWQVCCDESGAGLVEYALLLALIAVACVSSIFPGIRDALNQIFTNAASSFSSGS
jgi:Flp pilus assembly pilin Flp